MRQGRGGRCTRGCSLLQASPASPERSGNTFPRTHTHLVRELPQLPQPGPQRGGAGAAHASVAVVAPTRVAAAVLAPLWMRTLYQLMTCMHLACSLHADTPASLHTPAPKPPHSTAPLPRPPLAAAPFASTALAPAARGLGPPPPLPWPGAPRACSRRAGRRQPASSAAGTTLQQGVAGGGRGRGGGASAGELRSELGQPSREH